MKDHASCLLASGRRQSTACSCRIGEVYARKLARTQGPPLSGPAFAGGSTGATAEENPVEAQGQYLWQQKQADGKHSGCTVTGKNAACPNTSAGSVRQNQPTIGNHNFRCLPAAHNPFQRQETAVRAASPRIFSQPAGNRCWRRLAARSPPGHTGTQPPESRSRT